MAKPEEHTEQTPDTLNGKAGASCKAKLNNVDNGAAGDGAHVVEQPTEIGLNTEPRDQSPFMPNESLVIPKDNSGNSTSELKSLDEFKADCKQGNSLVIPKDNSGNSTSELKSLDEFKADCKQGNSLVIPKDNSGNSTRELKSLDEFKADGKQGNVYKDAVGSSNPQAEPQLDFMGPSGSRILFPDASANIRGEYEEQSAPAETASAPRLGVESLIVWMKSLQVKSRQRMESAGGVRMPTLPTPIRLAREATQHIASINEQLTKLNISLCTMPASSWTASSSTQAAPQLKTQPEPRATSPLPPPAPIWLSPKGIKMNPELLKMIKLYPNYEFRWMCSICDAHFPNKFKLRHHMTRVHHKSEFQVDSKLFEVHGWKTKPDLFGSKGPSYSSARSSSVVKTTEINTTCGYCGIKTKSPYSLNKHLRDFCCSGPRFPCSICGLTFSTPHAVMKHRSAHSTRSDDCSNFVKRHRGGSDSAK